MPHLIHHCSALCHIHFSENMNLIVEFRVVCVFFSHEQRLLFFLKQSAQKFVLFLLEWLVILHFLEQLIQFVNHLLIYICIDCLVQIRNVLLLLYLARDFFEIINIITQFFFLLEI